MISLRRFKPDYYHYGRTGRHNLHILRDSRSGFNGRNIHPRWKPTPKVSLIEELFPKEGGSTACVRESKDQELPRLPLPEVDEFFEEFLDDLDHGRTRPNDVTKTAAENAFRNQRLAVLILQTASKSLVEGDFRRVAPRGKHIGEWTGPGNILKVIPARDPRTLEQATFYFILFPNPAYARTYQNHVNHLHRVARTHTPTSIESPLPLQSGVMVEGEDVYSLLQDYALCPPSQKIQLRLQYPSHTPGAKALISERGYPQLVKGTERTARSVLLRVDGQYVTTSMLRSAIGADGRHNGLAWNVSIEKLDTSVSAIGEEEDVVSTGHDVDIGSRPQRYNPSRWILAFTDETEARRFIRHWHRKPFPSAHGGDARSVYTEFLW